MTSPAPGRFLGHLQVESSIGSRVGVRSPFTHLATLYQLTVFHCFTLIFIYSFIPHIRIVLTIYEVLW